MSFYEDSSWLLIPSGIKEDVVFAQKPTSGLGDLSFTRASDATYTDSTGVVRRSPYNLVQYSEQFDNAYWSKPFGWTVTPNALVSPDGTANADLVTPTNFNNIGRSFTVSTSTTYTPSIYLKRNNTNFSWVSLVFSGGTSINYGYQINWSTFTIALISGRTAAVSPTFESVGNGWYRISFGCASNNNTSASFQIIPDSQSGVNSLYLWGAQLVEGTEALDYFPTTNRQNVPRIDFRNADGTLSSCGRLLLEPQRTNSIRNSSMVGAVAGTPGTLPTNWSLGINALSSQIVSVGTENGLPYVNLRLFGTASDTSGSIRLDTNTGIAASASQNWSNAFYLKQISGTIPATTIGFSARDSSSVFISSQLTSVSITSELNRVSATHLTPASTAYVVPIIGLTFTIGAAYDFTIRIAAPQMELGAYATTWVPTTTAAVTRLADTASKTGVSSLIGQTEGTLFCEVNIRANKDSVRALQVSDGTPNNRIQLAFNVNNFTPAIVTGGVAQASFTVPFSAGNNKIAIGYASNDVVVYLNGVQVGTDTSATNPACSLLDVGQSIGGINTLGDGIAQAALFTTRLTNAQLAQLTTL